MKNKLPVLYVVVPCYNEEEVLPETSKQFRNELNEMKEENLISSDSKIVFVNDGSKDKTWEVITKLHVEDKIFQGLKLSRNKGHQNALVAGLSYAISYADITITIDADLQDDVKAMKEFVKAYHEGNDVVYGVRSSRKKDTFFKRTSALGFYKLMKWMGVDIVYNHADYRLMSKRAVEGLLAFDESNLFLRGMVPLIGYPSTVIKYERHERFAGTSKYPLKKMISFALDGITSFSVKPLKMISRIGILMFLISIGFLIYSIVVFFMNQAVDGWATLMCSIWMLGGIQLLMLGIVGEYIGKIYKESKRRPKFFIEDILDN